MRRIGRHLVGVLRASWQARIVPSLLAPTSSRRKPDIIANQFVHALNDSC
jgi:hypothetical protein